MPAPAPPTREGGVEALPPRRVYRDRSYDSLYNGYIDLWLAGPTGRLHELFTADGLPREHGSSGRIAFWRGFHGTADIVCRGSAKAAIRAAGRYCGRVAKRRAPRPPSPAPVEES